MDDSLIVNRFHDINRGIYAPLVRTPVSARVFQASAY